MAIRNVYVMMTDTCIETQLYSFSVFVAKSQLMIGDTISHSSGSVQPVLLMATSSSQGRFDGQGLACLQLTAIRKVSDLLMGSTESSVVSGSHIINFAHTVRGSSCG